VTSSHFLKFLQLLSLGFGSVLENNVIHEVFFSKISIIHFQQLTYVQKLDVR
jgi:hypothetical protein